MNENKRKYEDYLEANEELEIDIDEAIKVKNELKLSVVNQLAENDKLQSEVRNTIQNTFNCFLLSVIIMLH